MADYCKLSQSSFSHMFKDRMGMSPMHYLNYQRIEKAKDFLLSNSMTISNISRLVGFDDPLYFSRVFKKYTGASPQAYYQNLGNTNTPDWFLNNTTPQWFLLFIQILHPTKYYVWETHYFYLYSSPKAKEVTMILHYSTEGSIHVSDNLEDVLSQIGMNANDIALAKVKYYVLHTQMISILLYLTAKPLLHASQPDKIIGTTRSTPGQSVFDNVCFVPDSKRHSDKFKRYFEDCFWTRKNPRNKKFLRPFRRGADRIWTGGYWCCRPLPYHLATAP